MDIEIKLTEKEVYLPMHWSFIGNYVINGIRLHRFRRPKQMTN